MLIPFFAGILLITILDQAAKLFAVGLFVQYGSTAPQLIDGVTNIPLFKDVFHFTYVENPGAGWGIFSDHTWLLTIVTFVVIIAAVTYMVVKRPANRLLVTGVTFMIGGAVGNLIDRVRLGYVIDFFDFTLIDFPVFNVADCFITVGAIIFVIYVIFFSDKKEK
ncbi:MAG: signal peptidase II [Clostridia bacterium]|nr:signal peptidase II [Clostridia bacterium]